MTRLLPLAVAAVAAALAATACGNAPERSGGSVDAVASTTQVADLVRRVGGRRVALERLLSAEADPHDYEPRPSAVRAIERADVVFRSGGDIDGWLGDLVDEAGGEAEVVDLIRSVRPLRDGGEPDPHWWQDPRRVALAAPAVAAALAQADPEGRAVYERRAASYAATLRRLDRQIADCIEEVPPRKRKLVTTHDALGYFARRYGIEVIGALIPSLSTQAQPSARDVDRLVDRIRREDVEAIFPEGTLNPKLERAVARDAGATVGPPLWVDTLGPRGSEGETYLEAMAANTEALVEGMTGGDRSCRPRP